MPGGNAVGRGGGVLAAKKAAKFDSFVLLDNQVGNFSAPSTLGSLETALGFSSSKPDRKTLPDKGLQDLVDDLVKADKQVAKAAFAVIDLTEPTPRYAGHRATEPQYPASMGKTMLMLAAFQLRFDLAALAAREKITDIDALFDRAAEIWDDAQHPPKGSPKTTLRAKTAKLPKIELENDHVVLVNGSRLGMGNWGKVKLDRIFDKTGGVSPPQFKSDGLAFADLYYIEYPKERAKFKDTTKLGLKTTTYKKKTVPVASVSAYAFLDRLRLAIGFSSNDAPSTLARDLSLVHVNSPLWRSGLYDPEHHGLWLGNPYQNDDVWRGPPLGGNSTSATALAFVTFFAAIFRDKVTDAASCAEMRKMLQKMPTVRPTKSLYDDPANWNGVEDGHGTKSFIRDALVVGQSKKAKVHSKLGIFNGYSDTAHVERVVGGKTLKYVISIMDVPESDDMRLDAVAQKVDDLIVAIN